MFLLVSGQNNTAVVTEAPLTTVSVETPTTTVPVVVLNTTTPLPTTIPPQINPLPVNETLPTTVPPSTASIILDNITTPPVSQASNNATSS